MENFNFEYQTKVYFGYNSVEDGLTNELKKYGKKVMLTYGAGSIKQNGIYEEIINFLKENNKEIIEFNNIMPNPTYEKVLAGSKIARENNVDLILAVGGGSVIDCSKVIATQAVMDEDIWNMEINNHKLPNVLPIPLGAIVTVSGTGSEMNGGAVITNEEIKVKTGIFSNAPKFAILNPNYTMSVKFPQVISGAFDTLSHAMETYFGYPNYNNVSDDVNEAIMRNVIKNILILINDEKNYEARSNLMWDSAMAENGILKIGKKTDFQVHMIEHQLAAYTDCNHGEGLAVIHPTYYRHIFKYGLDKFVKFAKNVWGISQDNLTDDELALKGIDALEEFIKKCNLPTKLLNLKSKINITDKLIEEVAYSTTIMPNSYKRLTHNEIYEILKECM